MGDQYFKQSPEQLEEFLGFMEKDIENVRRVIKECEENDLKVEFMVHAKAETVQESADNTNVDRSEIVKTLVFKAGEEFVAVLCPGDKRVDEEKLEQVTEKEVRMAKPEEVKDSTGYVVGGVSAFDLEIPVYMEESILEKEEVKPAAGSRVLGVKIDPEDLEEVTGATIESLT